MGKKVNRAKKNCTWLQASPGWRRGVLFWCTKWICFAFWNEKL